MIRVAVTFTAGFVKTVIERLTVDDVLGHYQPGIRVQDTPYDRLVSEPVNRIRKITVVVLSGGTVVG